MIPPAKSRRPNRSPYTLLCALLLSAQLQTLKAEPPNEPVQQLPSIDLSSAPPAFLQELDRVQKALGSSGNQISVAGRVDDDSGSLLQPGDFTVALKRDVATEGAELDLSQGHDTYKYKGGWFISRPADQKRATVFAMSFDQRPVAKQLLVKGGDIAWVHVVLPKAAPQELSVLQGIVTDEDGKPLSDATVTLTASVTNGYYSAQASQSVTTDAKGTYSLNQIVNLLPYTVQAAKSGYSFASVNLYPNSKLKKGRDQGFIYETNPSAETARMSVGEIRFDKTLKTTKTPYRDSLNIQLVYPRRVTIDYEFQVENQFTENPELKRAVLEERGHAYFQDGSFREYKGKPSDLRIQNLAGTMIFSHFYIGNNQGHYDLGEVAFESVKALDLSKLMTGGTECRANHTYGLRTSDGKYVKLIVRDIEVIKPQ